MARYRLITLALAVVLVALRVPSCRKPNVPEDWRIEKNWKVLKNIKAAIECAEAVSGESPPLSVHDLSQWIVEHFPGAVKHGIVRVDKHSGVILDYLGQPIIVVTENGTVLGIGSAGNNGRWDGGTLDDLYLPLRIREIVDTGNSGIHGIREFRDRYEWHEDKHGSPPPSSQESGIGGHHQSCSAHGLHHSRRDRASA